METYEYNGWELVLDPEQVFPEDPGMGMPVLVRAPNGDWGSYNFAIDHGTCWDTEIPANVMRWLVRMEYKVLDFNFG